MFPNKESLFGYILEGLGIDIVAIFVAIRNILQPFGNFFPVFVCCTYLEKSGKPWPESV
jgi:hypothetical protein